MFNYFKEDIEISKSDFSRLFTSYSLTVFTTIPAAIMFHFRVILNYNLPIWFVCITFLGFVCGCFLTGFLMDKKVPLRLFWTLYIIVGIALYFLADIVEIMPTDAFMLVLFLVGFLVSSPWVPSFVLIGKITKTEERGRVIGLLHLLGGILFLIVTISTMFVELYYQFFIFGTLFLITGVLNVIFNKDPKPKISQHEIEIKEKINKRDFSLNCLICFAICFLWGFVILNVGWGVFNAFALQAGYSIFGSFASIIGSDLVFFFIAIDFIVVSFVLGLISDKFGRKIIWIIAISTIIFALFLFGLFQNPYFIIIFSISLGISLPATLIGMLNFISDSISLKKLNISFGILISFGWGLGLALGLTIGVLFLSFPITNFALIAVFIAIIGILLIVYTQETLPPKKERQWFSKLQHLYVIDEGGINLFNYSFSPHKTDALLVAGGISGLCSLVQELTMSASELKVIKQENATIILNYGSHITSALITTEDLKILHGKLELFTQEFERFFSELLEAWTGETTVFIPTKAIVEKIFEVEKFKTAKL